MRSNRITASTHFRAFGCALLGFAYGCWTTFFALTLAGAGHGWMAGGLCGLGIFVLPLLGLSIAYKGTRFAHILLRATVLGMLVVDAVIIVAATHDGWGYFWEALTRSTAGVVLWLFFWIAWQVFALHCLYREHKDDKA